MKVWRQGLVLHNRNSEQYGELAVGKSLCEVSLVRFSDSRIGETTYRAENTATVYAVADRERSAVLEGVAKPREVADVGDQLLALSEVFVVRTERLRTVRCLYT